MFYHKSCILKALSFCPLHWFDNSSADIIGESDRFMVTVPGYFEQKQSLRNF